jgi:hypothetical protein
MPYYCMHFSTDNDINISNNGTSVWINDVSKSVIGDVVITTPSIYETNTKIPINAVKYQLF